MLWVHIVRLYMMTFSDAFFLGALRVYYCIINLLANINSNNCYASN